MGLMGGSALILSSACGAPPVERSPTEDRQPTDRQVIEIGLDNPGQDEPQWDPGDWEDEPYVPGNPLSLSDVVLEAVLGPVAVQVGDTVRVDAYHEAYGADGFTEVMTTAPDVDDGAAMVLLFFQGGLDHEALVPGAEFSFSRDTNSIEGLSIDAIGCSGPEDGNWSDFDVPADDIDVVVEEGEEPGTQVLSYFATFYDYDGNKTSAAGSFTYNPDEL